tara:strand:- start:2066 stop:2281 length:216 start_codon:yes stop_codon:yes gene_type:complete
MIDNVIKALREGKVLITFTSLSSGRKIEDVYTLQGVNLPQNPQNNKLVVLHCETNTYEDIEKETIIQWVKC